MTDEEKAEEYYEDNECYSYLSEVEDFEEVFDFVKDRVTRAYLDGLTEGKMRWHDLRKDPNDLPTLDGMYWTYNECGYYDIHIWISQLWEECKIIAWCELPKFEE